MRVYAIGDVHGHLDKLEAAHRRIEADGGGADRVVHVGDLIDGGTASAGVVAFLMAGQAEGRDWIVVKGNHDQALPAFLRDPLWIDRRASDQRPWIIRKSGAAETLASYGVRDVLDRAPEAVHAEALVAVPAEHAAWLDALPHWHLTPRGLFVHAGIRPGVGLLDQDPDDLMWMRRPFLDDPRDHGVLVVHGHTPVAQVTHYGNRLNVDTGATRGGPVSAVRLDADGAWLLTDDGPVRLTPDPGAPR